MPPSDPAYWQRLAILNYLIPPPQASLPIPPWQHSSFLRLPSRRRTLWRLCWDSSISSMVGWMFDLLNPKLETDCSGRGRNWKELWWVTGTVIIVQLSTKFSTWLMQLLLPISSKMKTVMTIYTMYIFYHLYLTFIFLYCNVSTLNPIVGIVCTASSLSFCSRYKIVVLPALSNPKIRIRTSFDPKRLSNIRLIMIPIFETKWSCVMNLWLLFCCMCTYV